MRQLNKAMLGFHNTVSLCRRASVSKTFVTTEVLESYGGEGKREMEVLAQTTIYPQFFSRELVEAGPEILRL